jgi:uncharacterized membrane protein YdjX (TVP38/TMEM64 family)
MDSFDKKLLSLSKNTVVRSIVFLFILGAALGLISDILSRYLSVYVNPIVGYFSDKLVWLLVLYFLYGIIQAFIAPLPSLPADIVIFVIVGPIITFFIGVLSVLTGYSLSYFTSRRYGIKFLERILPIHTFEKVADLSQKMNWKHFFGLCAIPFNQLDLMPYVAGLSKLKYWPTIAILAITIGYRFAFTLYILNRFWVK